MRKLSAIVLAVLVVAVGANWATAKKAGPVVVFEDAANDAGPGEAPTPGFTEAGFDIVSGSIAKVKSNLEFTVTHAAMPPSGTLPEGFRFLWAFNVDGTDYRFTVKSADIGKPDLVAGTGQERVGKVYPTGHFRLEGDCSSNVVGAVNFINCKPLAYLEGRFDPANKSFTVILPLKLVKAKPGSVIIGGGGDSTAICLICWGTHVAERTSSATLIDTAAMSTAYKVPK